MSLIINRYEMDIIPLKKRFWIAAGLLLLMVMVFASQIRTRLRMEKTHAELIRAKAGLARVQEATANRKKALEILKTVYMMGITNVSDERLLYGKIEELKFRLGPDDMTISAIEKKGGEVSLPFTLTFINPNYSDFLNTISYLEGTVFPFTQVSAIAVTQAEAGGKGVVSCTINGKILTSERGQQ
jgi:hypothetical protein